MFVSRISKFHNFQQLHYFSSWTLDTIDVVLLWLCYWKHKRRLNSKFAVSKTCCHEVILQKCMQIVNMQITMNLNENVKNQKHPEVEVTYVSRTFMPTESALVMASTYSWSAASVSGPKYVPTPKDDTVRSPAGSVWVGRIRKWPFPARHKHHINNRIKSRISSPTKHVSGLITFK